MNKKTKGKSNQKFSKRGLLGLTLSCAMALTATGCEFDWNDVKDKGSDDVQERDSKCPKTDVQALKAGVNAVKFKSLGNVLAGNLYLPDGYSPDKKYPTIIFSGPFNQVKEQTGAVYGEKMRSLGYVVLVFDHIGYGDSEGKVRNFEFAPYKMESIRDGISYLRTLSIVDRDRFYGLGVCASGGYMPMVASTDKRLKAIATISGTMDNIASNFATRTREQLMDVFKTANDARQLQYETGKVEYYDALGYETLDPTVFPERNAVREGWDYYMTARGGTETFPNYSHLAPKTLSESSPLYSAMTIAPYLYTPYLGIIGSLAMGDTGPLTVSFYEAASEPKELYVIEDASHVSLYDIDKDVSRAAAKMDEFFKKYEG